MWWQPLRFIGQLVEGLTPPLGGVSTLSASRACFLIISNSNISCFSRITSQLYNGRVNFRTHQNITFYFLQLIHIERLINTSTSGYQKTKIIHCLKIFLIRIKKWYIFLLSSSSHTGQLLSSFWLLGYQISLLMRKSRMFYYRVINSNCIL